MIVVPPSRKYSASMTVNCVGTRSGKRDRSQPITPPSSSHSCPDRACPARAQATCSGRGLRLGSCVIVTPCGASCNENLAALPHVLRDRPCQSPVCRPIKASRFVARFLDSLHDFWIRCTIFGFVARFLDSLHD